MEIQSERKIGLDLVRAIAILMVVIVHCLGMVWQFADTPETGPAIGGILLCLHPIGIYGVELFFVLSGFLIGGILIRTVMKVERFDRKALLNFWIRRWFRTLPTYWLVFTATIILYKTMHLEEAGKAKFLYYVFLQNLWYPHLLSFFMEAWSLSIEEWFYLTLPIAIFVSQKIFRPVDKQRFLFRVFVSYLLVFVVVRIINAFHPLNGPSQFYGIMHVVVFRLDAVMYGVLMAYAYHFHPAALYKARRIFLVLGVAGFVAIHYLIYSPQYDLVDTQKPVLKYFSDAFLYLFLPLIFSFFLPYAVFLKSMGSVLLESVTRFISKISYSLYLVNFTLIYVPFFYERKYPSHISVLGHLLLYWAICISLAALLYRFFERPVMNLRDRFTK